MSNLSALDLAALLCSRVCHDVVGSVGAISNGLEVLDEEKDAEMREIAGTLVRKSAAQASAKLTFSRIAFGAAGSAGAEIDLDDAREKAELLLSFEKANLIWDMPRDMRPKNEVKLLLNLILVGLSVIPRGGDMTVSADGERGLKLVCNGRNARIPGHAEWFENLPQTLDDVDAHSVQPIYAALLADACNMKVTFSLDGERVDIVAG
tara:strand:- start:3210 stop:3830 length:621 start_codon:yes stop_codon:yes gene_type:complete